MKYCVIILDGAAGWPVDELGGRTTLQAASTPNLDALAAFGTVGLAQTVPPGAEPSSAAACMAILGYDPVANFVGRGAIEAASMGIPLAADEVALRLNLVTIGGGRMRSYACGHVPSEESRPVVDALQAALGDDTFRFYPGVAYRHILVVKGHAELTELAFTAPHDITDRPIEGRLPSGRGAELLLDLMDRAREVLPEVPANKRRAERGDMAATDIWPFWPGVAPRGLRPFSAVRGVSAAMTSGVDLLNGLATLTGIDRLDIPGVTDGSDNDYAGQAGGALSALHDHDLVIIHVESPDEEGHAGDVAGKVAAIEAIDREVVWRVAAWGGGRHRILAMPDHPTPTETKTHAAEPVPFVVTGPGLAPNGAACFDEVSAAATGLVVDPGWRTIDLLLR